MNYNVALYYLFCLFLLYAVATAGIVFYMGYDFSPLIAFELWDEAIKSGTSAPQALRHVSLGAVLIAGIAVILNPYMKNTKDYGDARWANRADLKKMELLENEGLILGTFNKKFIRTKTYVSMLFLAPPDSMKSVGLMIPNLLSIGDSVLVYDIKYDLFNKTSKRRSTFSEIFRFSPADEDSARFNPLSIDIIGTDINDAIGSVESIATIIFPEPKNADAHWVLNARKIFMFFALINITKAGETTIPNVRRDAISTSSATFEAGDELLTGTLPWIANYLDENSEGISDYLLTLGNDLMGIQTKEFGSIFNSFTTGLNGFADPRCERAFSECDFSPKSMREKRQSVYLCVKNKDSKRFEVPIRIMLEAFNDYFLSNTPSKDEFGVTNFIDEFPRLGKMDVVIDAPALQRSNRVRTIFACQDEGQISEIYGRDKVSTFKSSCAFHLFVPQNTDELNKKISDACGQFTAKKKSYSVTHGSRTTSYSEEKRELILPQEVGSLPRGEMILHVQAFRNRPIKGRLALFFENKQMLKMIGSVEDEIVDESTIEDKELNDSNQPEIETTQT